MEKREIKRGRPVGVRNGHGQGTDRKKLMFSLYPEHIQMINEIGEFNGISNAQVVRNAITYMYENGGVVS